MDLLGGGFGSEPVYPAPPAAAPQAAQSPPPASPASPAVSERPTSEAGAYYTRPLLSLT